VNIHSPISREYAGIHIDDAVPPGLLQYKNCAPWRVECKDGEKAKVTYNPFDGKRAKPNDPATTSGWALAKARMHKLLVDFGQHPEGGMAVLLGPDQRDGTSLGGIDLDSCCIDGKFTDWADEIIGPHCHGNRVWQVGPRRARLAA
jgi:hypothetical protein